MIKGMWQKLAALVGQSNDHQEREEQEKRQGSGEFADKRSHSRFALNHHAECFVMAGNDKNPLPVNVDKPSARLIDISYGGMKITLSKSDTQKFAATTPEQIYSCLICLPDQKIPARLRIVYCSTSRLQAGCSFEHANNDTLIQLREVLEPLKTGESLRQTDPKMLNEKYASGNWFIYRGYGPTDFSVRLDEGHRNLVELIVTMRTLDTYSELSFVDGAWRTAKSAAKTSIGRASVQMLRDRELDPSVIRQTAQTLLGFDHPDDNHPLNLVYRELAALSTGLPTA
jgi:hypothetical protein